MLKLFFGRWFLQIFGAIFFLIGAGILVFNFQFLNVAEKTTAEVIHVDRIYNDGSVSYKPTVRFEVKGREYTAQSWMSSSGYNFDIGHELPILYNPSDPSQIRLDFFLEKWGFGAIFAAIGAFVIFIGRRVGKTSGGVMSAAMAAMLHKQAQQVREAQTQAEEGSHQPTTDDDEREALNREYVELESRESAEDHARETNYTPTVRRRR